MNRRPSMFKQRDVTAAVKAVVAAGQPIQQCEIAPDGKIIIRIGATATEEERANNPWDTIK